MDFHRDEGATIVLVAISMVVLIGFVGVVIDGGVVFDERRHLQNGADAAALAIAEDCARGLACLDTDAWATAQAYGDDNNGDGTARVLAVDLNLLEQTVRVHLGAEDASRVEGVAMYLMGLLGIDRASVSADATARWAAGVSPPIAISECETRLDSDDPNSPPMPAGVPVTLLFHDAPTQNPCPHHSASGEDVPGGFGWLSVTPGCTAVIEGGWIDGSTSVDPPAGGNTGRTMEELYVLLTETITVPVFDQIVGTGENACYHIASFSTFHVTDFKMYTANRYRGHTTIYNNPSCLRLAGGGNQTVCFDGYFIAHGLPLSAGIRVVVELIE